jgi:hypothetical protein
MFLLQPSLRDWLPEDHLAYFVIDVVDQLDLTKIEAVYEKDDRGRVSMLKNWLKMLKPISNRLSVFWIQPRQKFCAIRTGYPN